MTRFVVFFLIASAITARANGPGPVAFDSFTYTGRDKVFEQPMLGLFAELGWIADL